MALTLTDSLVHRDRHHLDSPAIRLRLVRQTGQVIGARPPREWLPHIDRVTAQLGIPSGMLHLEVVDAGQAWTTDPERATKHQLAAITGPRRSTWDPPDAVTRRYGPHPPRTVTPQPGAGPRRPVAYGLASIEAGPAASTHQRPRLDPPQREDTGRSR